MQDDISLQLGCHCLRVWHGDISADWLCRQQVPLRVCVFIRLSMAANLCMTFAISAFTFDPTGNRFLPAVRQLTFISISNIKKKGRAGDRQIDSGDSEGEMRGAREKNCDSERERMQGEQIFCQGGQINQINNCFSSTSTPKWVFAVNCSVRLDVCVRACMCTWVRACACGASIDLRIKPLCGGL